MPRYHDSNSPRGAAKVLLLAFAATSMACEAPEDSPDSNPPGTSSRGAEGAPWSFLDVPSEDGGATLSFTDIHFEAVGATRAVLRFRTSRATSCEAEYGPTPELGSTAEDPSMEEGTLAIDHRVVFEDLTPETDYHVRARAEDAEERVYLSGMFELRTAANGDAIAAENVALASAGAQVSAVSSNFGGGGVDETWGASHAIDGSMGSEWSSAGDGDAAWLQLDLGMERQLEFLGYRSREMQDGTSIVTRVRLLVGDDVYGPFDTPDPTVRYLFELTPPPQARHVRFEAVESTGGNTGAREIELYGR